MLSVVCVNPPSHHQPIDSSPDASAETRVPNCFDFWNPDEAQRDIPIAQALEQACRIADVCGRSGGAEALLQRAFWRRQVEDLERDMHGGARSEGSREVNALAGPYAEDLRWRVLRFERRNDAPWRDLCRSIDRYFTWREDEKKLQADSYRTGDDALWQASKVVGQEAGHMLRQLHEERAQMLAQTSSALAPDVAMRESMQYPCTPSPSRLTSRPTLRLESRLTPTAPPMSASWFDENGIVYPPKDISGRTMPSPDRTASRP